MRNSINKAVFAFSADPVTRGHVDIVNRASGLFDEIIIATIKSTGKAGEMFSGTERMMMIRLAFANLPEITQFRFIDGATVDFCKEVDAKYLIRGIRGYTDLDYEYKLAYLNKQLSNGEIETIFIPGDPTLSMYSSTTVRELIRLGNDTWKKLVPDTVVEYIENKENYEK